MRQRDKQAAQGYEMTYQFATLAPPPSEVQQLLAALRGNQEQINCYFGTLVGTVSIAEFFSPENLERIFAAGVQDAVV